MYMILDGVDEDWCATQVLQNRGHIRVQYFANGVVNNRFAVFGAEDEMRVKPCK
jgi:hypothetical protein